MPRHARFALLSLLLLVVQLPLLPARARHEPAAAVRVPRKTQGPLSSRLTAIAQVHAQSLRQRDSRAAPALDYAALARTLSLPPRVRAV